MNDLICSNNKKDGISCAMAFTLKVILIIVVAELAIYIFTKVAGVDSGALVNSLLRGLIIGVGIFLLLGRKKPEPVHEEPKKDEASADVIDDESKKWPNIDILTRTSNELGLTISILELMALADRYSHRLSIGMIKIDGLENLEKSAADDAVINMAGLMAESIRMPDRIGRFKDDVFMTLLPESGIDGATIVANRLRQSLEQGKNEEYASEVSVWIGMTEFQRGEDLQSLLDRVEAAVNQARNEDNGICIKLAEEADV